VVCGAGGVSDISTSTSTSSGGGSESKSEILNKALENVD
jgi:hypothetical protein